MSAVTVSKSEDYRRKARRLRHVYADRPAELYGSLRALSAEHDAKSDPNQSARGTPSRAFHAKGVTPAARAHVDRFILQIEKLPLDQPLTYSHRLRLLKLAGKLGIERFQANLIIAAIQHRHGVRFQSESPWNSPIRQGWLLGITVVLLQAGILASAWMLFVR